MDEVGGAVISIAVVLTAVFVPTALVSGISGQFYRQFALTIAIATLISAFNSLTLSPALAALLIRPGQAKKDLLSRLIDTLLGWFFRLFNRTFDLGIAGYGAVVRRLLRVSGLVLVVYIGLLALTGLMFQKIPAGYIPNMDQGYIFVFAQPPDGASLQRTDVPTLHFTTSLWHCGPESRAALPLTGCMGRVYQPRSPLICYANMARQY